MEGKVEGCRLGSSHLSSLGPVPDVPHQQGRKKEERKEKEGSHSEGKEPVKW